MVAPAGLSGSWNAGYCCGKAMEEDVDNIGFLQAIRDELTLMEPTVGTATYAFGWSNGAFLAVEAALRSDVFDAVAPISGMSYSITESLTLIGDRRKTSSSPRPAALMAHHALDDPYVRYSGCCKSSLCCCNICRNCTECVPTTTGFDRWAQYVNGCDRDTPYVVTLYTTVTADDEHFPEGLPVTCYSAQNCKANTTLCTYHKGNHFAWGDAFNFGAHFPVSMTQSIAVFFAKEACASGSQSFCKKLEAAEITTVPPGQLMPTGTPSAFPTDTRSALPTDTPSTLPTGTPSTLPTDTPSTLPTEMPSALPTEIPSGTPSRLPTDIPSDTLSAAPTHDASARPSMRPTSAQSTTTAASVSLEPSRGTEIPTSALWSRLVSEIEVQENEQASGMQTAAAAAPQTMAWCLACIYVILALAAR